MTTIVALIALVLGLGFLVVKSKPQLGKTILEVFSTKRNLILELMAFLLVPLHAHIAADLGVKLTGAIYAHRFAIHFVINFIGFALAMSLYKNGADVTRPGTNKMKEIFELLFILLGTWTFQWMSLFVMCTGFGKPYLAVMRSAEGLPLDTIDWLMSMNDFSIVTSFVIILSEALVALFLAVMGASSNTSSPSAKSSSSGGGFLSNLFSMFKKPVAPTSTISDAAKFWAQQLNQPAKRLQEVMDDDKATGTRLTSLYTRAKEASPFQMEDYKRQARELL